MQSNVVSINTHQRQWSTAAGPTIGTASGQVFPITIEREAATQQVGANVLSPAELYPDLQAQDGRVIQALSLLRECADHLQLAAQTAPQLDFIAYDEEMMRARSSLRRLFALREISDGFGAAIGAIIWALRKKESEPLSARQISTIAEVLSQLRKKPMLHFDTSTNLVDQLEDAELDVEPPFMQLLTEYGND